MASAQKTDNAPAERKANPFKSFITGGFGGICNVLSGHPLDTIKVSLLWHELPVDCLTCLLCCLGTFANNATASAWWEALV